MAGLSHSGGSMVDGFEHLRQSIACILSTPIGSRVMQPEFGSRLPELIDAIATERNLLAVWTAVADALERWEPRFEVSHVALDDAPEEIAAGRVTLRCLGTYYPRGHLGDFEAEAEPGLSLSITV